ncbi:MAG: UDP-N-acetylglucosamine 2-epimerase (non-hydrolyzing) [Dehalococcoidales bacterium]|nr:UDP-N-acetylglucosamine 2-epimerase (non-hydrolyzing) [Dehalococcoidales bacterium]
MKIALVLGTRPEIIKLSPVIKELEKRGADYFIIHTGQHYSYNMDKIFFNQLRLPEAKYNLEVGSGSHAEQTANILKRIEKVYRQEKPDILLVQGDTNTVLAGALAATKLHIQVGHVESGLRSYDRNMPEEVNRVLADHCSDYLFAPTEKAGNILRGEGIPEEKIYITGNTIVDAVYQNLEIANSNHSDNVNGLRINPNEYFLVTLHRQENVDDHSRFASILKGLDRIASNYRFPVIYPIHPRSRKMIAQFKLNTGSLRLIEPADFFEFLKLEKDARLILTDSGGVQEESCILGTPCVTLRDNTERPETVYVGANVLAGANPEKILTCSGMMLDRGDGWNNPFGDGRAGERIVSILFGGKHV